MLRRLSLAALLSIAVSCLNLVAQDTSQPPAPPVDINSASVQEIEKIVGNEQLAEKIVEGRPYANKRQLLTRDLITAEQYERIRDLIVARRVQDAP